MRKALWLLLLAGLALLSFASACHPVREVFIQGRIFFTEGDCYARMTRARMVAEHPTKPVHFHRFENHPEGIRSHTTAPLDYTIVGLKVVLDGIFHLVPESSRWSVFRVQTLDLAGALISPLFGVLTCLYLGWWARWGVPVSGERQRGVPGIFLCAVVPLFCAISPILAHGFALGRPDHQGLLILLLAVALTAELALWPGAPGKLQWKRGWAISGGAAWGLALWVSLFEPLVPLLGCWLLAGAFTMVACRRGSAWPRERLWQFGMVGLGLALMLAIDGSPIPQLSPEAREHFADWGRTIQELSGLGAHPGAVFRWLGWACMAAPVLLVLSLRRDGRAWFVLVLLLGTLALTWGFLRWGYFLALAYAISLPWQLSWLRWRWLGWLALIVSVYPMAQEWEELLILHRDVEARNVAESNLLQKQRERLLLRQAAQAMSAEPGRYPFLAPWWLSPALAYWSGQPGVTGTAHEGLGGIVDSARFYLADSPLAAGAILERCGVAYVVADDPNRIVSTSAPLLRSEAPPQPFARKLYATPHSAAPFLQQVYSNAYFKVFAVDHNQIPHE